MEPYLTDEESERLENCASTSTTPQLWSADGGDPVPISEIVKQRGMATGKDGKKYHPKKWTPVGLDSVVKDWKPTGSADDSNLESCACDPEASVHDSEICKCNNEECEKCN